MAHQAIHPSGVHKMSSSGSTIDTTEWKCVVNRIIASWGGYQLGVDFGSGGSETLAKDEWFKDILAEYIATTKGLKTDDLEDWLTNILYTEFNLILEDDSVYPTSLILMEAFQYLKQNKHKDLDRLLEGLPSVESVREANKMSVPVCVEDEEMCMDDIDESVEINDEMEDDQSLRKDRGPRIVTDEEGWTTILRK
ncbi:hypothetical protein KIN20_032077 [Parelaphostrongylus tenuis]|uniref:Pre-rRNA-processing protein TSR2 homolog n=1 Tax=Parelaphostrongylus tenuis TaxID=148309 RepID=A0AAD5R6G0_PARTN|nr:hypothetical protein KIN20_032077 [Parelaphostrongylus tenuis]